MAQRLGEAVVGLVHLVNPRLRAIGGEAQRAQRLVGVGAGDGDGRNAGGRGDLRSDGEAEGGGLNDVLGLDCVKVEACVMDLKIVDGSRTDLPDPAPGILENIGGAEVAEAWNRAAGKRQCPRLVLMLMDADEVELVLLARGEVEAANILVETVGLYRV